MPGKKLSRVGKGHRILLKVLNPTDTANLILECAITQTGLPIRQIREKESAMDRRSLLKAVGLLSMGAAFPSAGVCMTYSMPVATARPPRKKNPNT